ncbi:MAG: hypothetical protein HYU38_07815 [Candidatus Tectomicrobia bacterium]|nr:hypothetical protein [Candidatus Tectomicrobia bacterium]
MHPLMVAADPEGRIFEHPGLAMVGALGREAVAPQPEELSSLPEGSRLFTLPGSRPVGGEPDEGELVTVGEADWGEGAVPVSAACTFPAPGWMRTLLPFAEREEGAPALPLGWSAEQPANNSVEAAVCPGFGRPNPSAHRPRSVRGWGQGLL